jgi:TRAP-type transport system small permease protein
MSRGLQFGVAEGILGESRFQTLGHHAGLASARLNWVVERVCALLAAVLVLDVWLGVTVRYLIPLPITFMEELARYLMIWMALLAVSCGISRREHIGVLILWEMLPPLLRRVILILIDLLAFTFFAFLFYYGTGFARSGFQQFTMIYGATKFLPFLAVPVACGLAVIQLVLVSIRDQAKLQAEIERERTA